MHVCAGKFKSSTDFTWGKIKKFLFLVSFYIFQHNRCKAIKLQKNFILQFFIDFNFHWDISETIANRNITLIKKLTHAGTVRITHQLFNVFVFFSHTEKFLTIKVMLLVTWETNWNEEGEEFLKFSWWWKSLAADWNHRVIMTWIN